MNSVNYILKDSRLLFITSTHPAWGKAHQQRIFAWMKEFSSCSYYEVLDLVLEKKYEPFPNMLSSLQQDNLNNSRTDLNPNLEINTIRSWKKFLSWQEGKKFDLAIIDRREPPPVLIESLSPMPIITFDIRSDLPESPLRRHYQKALKKITYVVNPIPSLEEDWANLNGLEYLILPDSGKSDTNRIPGPKNAVVYLGECNDPDYLNKVFVGVHKIAAMPGFCQQSSHPIPVKVIASPRIIDSVKASLPEGRLRGKAASFRYAFHPFDCQGMNWNEVGVIFTHFGLTGLEAIKRDIPVFFLEPTAYHRELVVKHFPELLMSRVDDTSPFLKKSVTLMRERLGKMGKGKKQLLDIFRELAKQGGGVFSSPSLFRKNFLPPCDLCGRPLLIEHRRSWMNLTLCSGCKSYRMITMYSNASSSREKQIWGYPNEDYNSDYFISEYKRSYGKSYQEDESEIKKLAWSRMKIIRSLAKEPHLCLLDIGCAYGFFLDVAAEFGCDTFGVDISSHAGKQIRDHKFIRGDFREKMVITSLKSLIKKTTKTSTNSGFDTITLWYVIEHFPDINPVIEKISVLHNPGGILGLSTPNAAGFSSRFRNREFLSSSPSDHYYIFSLAGLKKIMSKHGYDFIDYRATGIHYSRFRNTYPRLARYIPQTLYQRWATLTKLGDTMEVYFRKRLEQN